MPIELTCTERDIEDVLCDHTEYFLGLRYVRRQFRIAIGIVDIIAKCPERPGNYYVIEVKRGQLDASAYVQVLKYAHWLNSEYSKSGQRSFYPVLIGDTLHPALDHLSRYFESDECELSAIFQPRYRLFKFDPLSGISFAYRSISQNQAVAAFRENFCHVSNLQQDCDYAEYRLGGMAL